MVSHSLADEVTKLVMSGCWTDRRSRRRLASWGRWRREMRWLGRRRIGESVIFLASLRRWEIDMVLFLQSIGRIKIIVGSVRQGP